jgi:small-conductance mechanosensitive channel
MKFLALAGYILFSLNNAVAILFTTLLFKQNSNSTLLDAIIIVILVWVSFWFGTIFVWPASERVWKKVNQDPIAMYYIALLTLICLCASLFTALAGEILNQIVFESKCICVAIGIQTIQFAISGQISAWKRMKELFRTT